MADPAEVKAKLRAAFRDFRVDGVPASGANEPVKLEVRAGLDAVVDLAAQSTVTKAVATKANLATIPSPAVGDSARVISDPLGDVPNGNGVWSWTGSAWSWVGPWVDPGIQTQLDDLNAVLTDDAALGYALTFTDEAGNVAAGIKGDGTFSAAKTEFGLAKIDALTTGGQTTSEAGHAGYLWTIDDGEGRSSVGLREDGVLEVSGLETDTINGRKTDDGPVDRYGGAYPYQVSFVNNTGESLAEGSTGTPISTVQEYDSVCWPARTATGGPLLPLTVANGQYAARGENPMFGACAGYKALIERENGLSYQDNDFVLLACNNGYSGFKLAQIDKGTAPYNVTLSQAAALASYGAATGKSVGWLANLMTTGANDGNPAALTPTASFKAQLKAYASDIDVDARAILTNQRRPIFTIVNQLASRAPRLAVAQLECSHESNLIFVAGPMYQYGYYDTLHINPAGERAMGELNGKVMKRLITDGVGWEPLQPQRAWVSGSNVYVAFNKSGLVIDLSDPIVAVQPRYGFDCLDGASAVVVQSADPVIVGRDTLRLTFASAALAQSVATVRGAHNVSTGRSDSFVGGSTNLRDRDGNWCVVFSMKL
ncbi:hypothetical protein [Brevundimonas diminuta]|uniref:hypothetical protein n=1 Tax=Brevundimonas diminuta TaxID=293 RepID=UPI0030F8B823